MTARFMSGGIKWLSRTVRIEWIDRENLDELYAKKENFIFTYWHSELILATHSGAQEAKICPIVAMTSPSRDGAMIAENMTSQGVKVVLGSSGRGGAGAFRQFVKDLKSGMNGSVAVDGPKGPRNVVKPGPIRLAQMTGLPAVPFAIGYKKRWVTRSWDRLRIPYPYTTATIVCGRPLFFPRDMGPEEIDESAARLGRGLMELRNRLPYDNDLE